VQIADCWGSSGYVVESVPLALFVARECPEECPRKRESPRLFALARRRSPPGEGKGEGFGFTHESTNPHPYPLPPADGRARANNLLRAALVFPSQFVEIRQRNAQSHPFEDLLRGAIVAGGDTDTIGSIVGQIAGAALGLSGLPPELIVRLRALAQLRTVAAAFSAVVAA
jgi:hypothetical protein